MPRASRLDSSGSGSGGSSRRTAREHPLANGRADRLHLHAAQRRPNDGRHAEHRRRHRRRSREVRASGKHADSAVRRPGRLRRPSAGTDYRITKFEILVVLGGAPTPATAASPGSTSSPVGQAQGTASSSSTPAPPRPPPRRRRTVSQRDRMLLAGATVIALIGGVLALALARSDVTCTSSTTESRSPSSPIRRAVQEAEQLAGRGSGFPSAYATLVRLGKAVPTSTRTCPRLSCSSTRQRRAPASTSGRSPQHRLRPAPLRQPAPAATAPRRELIFERHQRDERCQGSTSTSSSRPSGRRAQRRPTGRRHALTAATLPIGATVGPAGLPVLQFNISLPGSFFKMADFFTTCVSSSRDETGT